jgi:hypothetical protein
MSLLKTMLKCPNSIMRVTSYSPRRRHLRATQMRKWSLMTRYNEVRLRYGHLLVWFYGNHPGGPAYFRFLLWMCGFSYNLFCRCGKTLTFFVICLERKTVCSQHFLLPLALKSSTKTIFRDLEVGSKMGHRHGPLWEKKLMNWYIWTRILCVHHPILPTS